MGLGVVLHLLLLLDRVVVCFFFGTFLAGLASIKHYYTSIGATTYHSKKYYYCMYYDNTKQVGADKKNSFLPPFFLLF